MQNHPSWGVLTTSSLPAGSVVLQYHVKLHRGHLQPLHDWFMVLNLLSSLLYLPHWFICLCHGIYYFSTILNFIFQQINMNPLLFTFFLWEPLMSLNPGKTYGLCKVFHLENFIPCHCSMANSIFDTDNLNIL